MVIKINTLPVFPLPIYLLPQGVTRLRIFEQRYLKMVRECAGSSPFALSVLDKSNEFNSSQWAAEVEIVDFESLEDGTLGITIKANQLLELSNFKRDEDDLLRATSRPIPHWPETTHHDISRQLAAKLEDVFTGHQPLEDLYPATHFECPVWVNQRWLEILPLTLECKRNFIQQDSFGLATNFIKTIVLDNQFKN